MGSVGAAALVVALVLCTGCLAAHSDRSRQRSGPIRSVPVAANVKRDTDFDCPEEFGYYSHPTDCTLYYVCVFGGALLESCTGGLMYSHELQTCDWPRNVGCDSTSAGAREDLERLNERHSPPPPPPPPPSPRRTPPPPPPRVQPKPIVTSRGQPKYIREEYEKQQQLYDEVDDLPPVEEIESDRQQRVYRGQPSTIGQVQKDRDGYVGQVGNSGRTLNANIIPASIQSTGKLGSFSFGTDVDDRRAAIVTQAPQSFSDGKKYQVTDSLYDRQYDLELETNKLNDTDSSKPKISRIKREALGVNTSKSENDTTNISKRNDDQSFEYVEEDSEKSDEDSEENTSDDTERGKRQIRFYSKNTNTNTGKKWSNYKPVKFVDLNYYNSNPNYSQKYRLPQTFIINGNNYYDNFHFSTTNPFGVNELEASQSQRPFKASLPDPSNQEFIHSPINSGTQIITKSPPISSLKNIENPFLNLEGSFNNNRPKPNYSYNNNNNYEFVTLTNRPNNPASYQDSSQLSSSAVTRKPISIVTSPRAPVSYAVNNAPIKNNHSVLNKVHQKDLEYDEEENSDEDGEENSDEEVSEESYDDYKHGHPEPPYEFSHPNHKYADIENPFADPNFDFDSYLEKLRDDHFAAVGTTPKYNNNKNILNTANPHRDVSTVSYIKSGISSTVNYNGMNNPRPFSGLTIPSSTLSPKQVLPKLLPNINQPIKYERLNQRIEFNSQLGYKQPKQSVVGNNGKNVSKQNAEIPLDLRPKLEPPNFNDDQILPIIYNFNTPVKSTFKPITAEIKGKGQPFQIFSVTPKPYNVEVSTVSPMMISTQKQQYSIKHEKIISLQPQIFSSSLPYMVSTVNPHKSLFQVTPSTSNTLTTKANEQLTALQNYWNHVTQPTVSSHSTLKPTTVNELAKLENLFKQTFKPSEQIILQKQSDFNIVPEPVITTTKTPLKRRPIPKPSPEMNDYYYDDEDDQYTYEPPVKPKYMPSSEIMPQRPPMAQNYKEYEDINSHEQTPNSLKTESLKLNSAGKYHAFKPEITVKNHNDVSVETKLSLKDSTKNNLKISVPIMLDVSSKPNYKIVPHSHKNKTLHLKRPLHYEIGPSTMSPPKYLNDTTLRPYTVRHRLAKPTTVSVTSTQSDDMKQTRGRIRHQNIVAQMRLTTTTPNSNNQETRNTKTNDDKTNSLEPTESVSPVSYTASPRPKMLYNGSQSYNPDQYDPYYAVYDEDGELYKDTDYAQQYNSASLRPAVQQTYRGTPPPVRRPVETYSPNPVSPDDYDEELIQGQINNPTQYQSAIRHSSRGEGNELGYEIPSSARTTIYEATTLSTTPSTTSTSTTTTTTTTTPRSTTAPFSEATPIRYTSRSSTDENPKRNPESSSNQNSTDGPPTEIPSTPSLVINFSSLAKPFEKTINSVSFRETELSTENLSNVDLASSVTNKNNKNSLKLIQTSMSPNNTKFGSITSGFSIRLNPNNTNNPYTLTIISRPHENYNLKSQEKEKVDARIRLKSNRFYYGNDKNDKNKDTTIESDDSYRKTSSENLLRRQDSRLETKENLPLYVRPTGRGRVTYTPKSDGLDTTQPTTETTKYVLKTVLKRLVPFKLNTKQSEGSTENNIDTEVSIESTQSSEFLSPREIDSTLWKNQDPDDVDSEELGISPLETLNKLRNTDDSEEDLSQEYTTTTSTSTSKSPQPTTRFKLRGNKKAHFSKPTYFSYRVIDEVPDHTTEVFSSKVKNVIRTFYDDLNSNLEEPRTSTVKSTDTDFVEPEVVNIGFHKKKIQYKVEKPIPSYVKRLEILTEPTINKFISPTVYTAVISEKDIQFTTETPPMAITTGVIAPFTQYDDITTTPTILDHLANDEMKYVPIEENNELKPINLTEKPEFTQTINIQSPFTERFNDETLDDSDENKTTKLTPINTEPFKTLTQLRPTNKPVSDFATTTSTTKLTTPKVHLTTTTKSLSFPTRASRVNPAIKLAAANPGGGRRSYQSSSNCTTDDSLQANPKCNEIKYQRPTSTRGRGSAHYTSGGSDNTQFQPTANRGTPPTRSRPTLKPSTVIVAKAVEAVDIYANPPSRPAPVYPQPTVDKTAAKCRKDVCLLPDCYCGGKDIPGDMPVETVPQMVILTFDDSVNDLNKGLYADLFEKGRVNPNGCPISATFYVSHEWTDYSQVQNLYAAGHEMASHTVSHSFGEQFSQKKWNREVGGQREILAAYGGVKLEDVRGMRAPFLSVGGNKMFKMLYDSNFTYDSSLPVYENRPPSWPYTLDYKLFHDCMIPPCPTKSYPGVWEVPMVMWQDLNGGRCSMGDACANPSDSDGVYKMILKNFDRHYSTNRAPFGLFYHAAWFTQPHHKDGFIKFLDFINRMPDVWIITNWQALQWVRDPTPISRINNFQPFQCNYPDRPKKCNNPKVCNLWHKTGVRYMRTCQPCPEIYPWTGKTGIKSSRIDNDIGE